LLVTNYISQPATFWRRSALERAGWLDESLHYVMDYDYWLRLWSLKPPRLLTRELAAFRVHAQSKTTSTGHLEKYVHEEEQVVARYTRSKFWRGMHDLHRRAMTALYARLNG
jgi:GT2 family glycosyltransferase